MLGEVGIDPINACRRGNSRPGDKMGQIEGDVQSETSTLCWPKGATVHLA